MARKRRSVAKYENPIENRNFLSPTGFQFSLKKIPGASFFCNEANIPSMDLGVAIQPSYLKEIPTPGDQIDFGDLTIRFLVDEDLENYMELQNWIRGLGFPESLSEFHELEDASVIPKKLGGVRGRHNIYSDGTLQILSNNLVPKFQVFFRDLFPFSLTTITFDASDTDIEYFTAEASFKYTLYDIRGMDNKPL
jgi:hypothetical protein